MARAGFWVMNTSIDLAFIMQTPDTNLEDLCANIKVCQLSCLYSLFSVYLGYFRIVLEIIRFRWIRINIE
jgi:hypothetical protein